MQPSMLRFAVILGLLSAVGPFAIDAYLPAMPEIERDLGAPISAVQMTLTVFFIAFGVAQLVYGPLADRYGRKLPLYVGLSVFLIATIGCAMAPDIGSLTALRFAQGLGAAVVMVVPRAIIRDLYTGPEATRLMALVMLVISVSPMLAPLAGSGLMALGGWRIIFAVLAVAALGSLAMTALMLPETLDPGKRVPVRLRALLANGRRLLGDASFMGLTFIGGFGMASFFVFIASAAFVYTGEFGLSPTGFSLAFAVNAAGFFGASQLAAPLGLRVGLMPMIRIAVIGFSGFTAALAGLTFAGFGNLYVVVGFLFGANACLGLVIPTTMVMALDEQGDIAGLASSLGGTLQMLAGGVMIALAAPFFDGTALPMVSVIAVCGLGALALTLWLSARMKHTAGAAG